MKVRNGFVSNSSSSSFICGLCGTIEVGYESCPSDFGMSTCEYGHEWHDECVYNVKELNWNKDEFYETSINFLNTSIKHYEEQIKKWSEEEGGYYIDIPGNKQKIVTYKNSITELEKLYKEQTEEEFLEEGKELIQCLLQDLDEYPEAFCPVCRLEKIYRQDPEWPKYIELRKKFSNLHTM